jgi:transcriptional regulator with XRE-family HTH domain
MKKYPAFMDQLALTGKRLRLLRHLKEEKIFTVANAIGISSTQLSCVENGSYEGLNLYTIYKLATYYGIHIHELLSPEKPPGEQDDMGLTMLLQKHIIDTARL